MTLRSRYHFVGHPHKDNLASCHWCKQSNLDVRHQAFLPLGVEVVLGCYQQIGRCSPDIWLRFSSRAVFSRPSRICASTSSAPAYVADGTAAGQLNTVSREPASPPASSNGAATLPWRSATMTCCAIVLVVVLCHKAIWLWLVRRGLRRDFCAAIGAGRRGSVSRNWDRYATYHVSNGKVFW